MSDTPATTDDVTALRAAAEAGNSALREVAFLRAGVDVSDPMRAHLMNTYSGANDAAAVGAYLEQLGVTPTKEAPPAAAAAAVAVDDGQQNMREILSGQATGEGATPAPAGNTPAAVVDPVTEAWQEFLVQDPARAMSTRSLETRQLAVIDRFIIGAGEGVKGMLFDADAWRTERAAVGHDFRPPQMQGMPVS